MLSRTESGSVTRREFIAASAVGSALVAIGCNSSKRGDWDFLTADEAQTLKTICDQIVPADDFPSASQAGVLDYIDRQLIRHYRKHQETYRRGLQRAEAMSRSRFGRDLAGLSTQQQFEIISALQQEEPEFFGLARNHTMEGYYGSPRHGGNRDAASWKMLGLPEPPLLGRAQYDLRKDAGR
jgi:gluconate 2-dehydrogenase gamma chain